MYTSTKTFQWQRGGAITLALFSLIVPLSASVPRDIASAWLTSPVQPSDERLTIAAFLLGIVSAVGAVIINRSLPTGWLSWVTLAVATLGGLITTFLVWSLIGSCGLQVVWDVCKP
jgi:hypothetical protein